MCLLFICLVNMQGYPYELNYYCSKITTINIDFIFFPAAGKKEGVPLINRDTL